MTLLLEIEYLSGVSFAAIGPDTEKPDWPPQPDRVFSALVATWAARGEDPHEACALEWLEALQAPRIFAAEAAPRTGAIVFVPPNDPRSDKKKSAKAVLPALRSRQPRRFPAARPYDSIVRLVWDDAEVNDETLSSLQRLARDTAYVGHSTSVTRCRFLNGSSVANPIEGDLPVRRVYPGRFAELRRSFEARRRPLPGARVAPVSPSEEERSNVFGDRWLLLEHVSGDMPDLRAWAFVARAARDTLLSGYRRLGLGTAIPEVVSGHAGDGSPSRAPHLAIIPLAFVGFPHADGHVMGLALVPPRESEILNDQTFRRILRGLAPIDEQRGRRILTVAPQGGSRSGRDFSIALSPTFEPPAGKRSLDPTLYSARSQTFATVTPVVLDRHLKKKGAMRLEEIGAQIAKACGNTGLPEPASVLVDKHAAIEGSPSTCPSGKSPAWMRWRLPQSLSSRQITHAVIRFPRPVEGPVILGAGRFVGLGLCRPLDEGQN